MKVPAKIIIIAAMLLHAMAAAAAVPKIAPGQVKVNEAQLRQDVEFLCDSLCAGRASGSASSVEAAGYIVRRLSSLGYDVQGRSFRIDSARVGHNILAGHSKTGRVILVMAYYDGLGMLDGRIYPGADSNASGVAAALALAERFKGRYDLVFAFLDGHNAGQSGIAAIKEELVGRGLSLVLNLDILGCILSPVDPYWKDYLIALGADSFRNTFELANRGLQLHLYYNYYRSSSFTDMFYRRIGDHKDFINKGIPTILFTSGITMNTNRPADVPGTLDYDVFPRRVEFIARFIENYGRK